jgi:NOL1/NOP2/fmu family ribosome biogenesis protein
MNCKFIKTPEKRKIIKELNNQFGIKELPYLLIETGKEKIRAFSGSLSKEEILELAESANIEIIGIYILRKEQEFRLSFDAPHILKKQITKNIIEIDETQAKEWMKGNDLQIKEKKGTFVIKHKDDFLGCGKSNGETIFNYVPKDRRIRK